MGYCICHCEIITLRFSVIRKSLLTPGVNNWSEGGPCGVNAADPSEPEASPQGIGLGVLNRACELVQNQRALAHTVADYSEADLQRPALHLGNNVFSLCIAESFVRDKNVCEPISCVGSCALCSSCWSVDLVDKQAEPEELCNAPGSQVIR